MKILTEIGYIDAVGVFLELTDEQLDIIQKNKFYFQDKELTDILSKSKGDNAHFVGACNNGEHSLINKHIKMLLNDYKTVSWWDKEMTDFKIRRR